MFIVPTFQNTSSKYVIGCALGDTKYRLKFFWNTRAQAWFMSILDQDDVAIITDIRLAINYALLYQYRAIEGIPDGEFILWDLEKDPISGGVTFDNFGRRYQLLFFTSEELESGEASGI